jgi:tetratricopeptide (TPR) repeat protein
VRLAEKAVKEEAKKPWNYTALGLSYYRAANYEAAIEQLQRSLEVDPHWLGGGHNYPVLALAYHRLGRAEEARQALGHSQRLIDQWSNEFIRHPMGTQLRPRGPAQIEGQAMLWWDWMSCCLLYREAKTVIDGSAPPEDLDFTWSVLRRWQPYTITKAPVLPVTKRSSWRARMRTSDWNAQSSWVLFADGMMLSPATG